MDTATGAALVMGLQVIGKPTMDLTVHLLKTLLTPAMEAGSQVLAQPIKDWHNARVTAATKVVTDAVSLLADAGLDPQPVPPKLLTEVLKNAVLEDDEHLQRKWAALLANAASSTASNKILPSYTDILRQLTPQQAMILDWMYGQEIKPDVPDWHSIWPDFKRSAIEERFGLSPEDYALFITDLDRLALIESRRALQSTRGMGIDMQLALLTSWINDRVQYREVSITTLGLRFIQACTPPQPAA